MNRRSLTFVGPGQEMVAFWMIVFIGAKPPMLATASCVLRVFLVQRNRGLVLHE